MTTKVWYTCRYSAISGDTAMNRIRGLMVVQVRRLVQVGGLVRGMVQVGGLVQVGELVHII